MHHSVFQNSVPFHCQLSTYLSANMMHAICTSCVCVCDLLNRNKIILGVCSPYHTTRVCESDVSASIVDPKRNSPEFCAFLLSIQNKFWDILKQVTVISSHILCN